MLFDMGITVMYVCDQRLKACNLLGIKRVSVFFFVCFKENIDPQ